VSGNYDHRIHKVQLFSGNLLGILLLLERCHQVKWKNLWGKFRCQSNLVLSL